MADGVAVHGHRSNVDLANYSGDGLMARYPNPPNQISIVCAERQKNPSSVDLTRHEWCDPRIIRAMLARWQNDAATIQELHDRAGVRPAKRVPRRYVQSVSTDIDDEDDF